MSLWQRPEIQEMLPAEGRGHPEASWNLLNWLIPARLESCLPGYCRGEAAIYGHESLHVLDVLPVFIRFTVRHHLRTAAEAAASAETVARLRREILGSATV